MGLEYVVSVCHTPALHVRMQYNPAQFTPRAAQPVPRFAISRVEAVSLIARPLSASGWPRLHLQSDYVSVSIRRRITHGC